MQIAGSVMPVAAVPVPPIQCLSQFCSAATILVYQASPAEGGAHLRAQRLDDLTDFGPDGVAVAGAAAGQMFVSAVPNDSGGVVIAWLELNSLHRWVYAQRIDAHGNRR